jgi:hypothetical protein
VGRSISAIPRVNPHGETRSPTHKPHPDSGGGELQQGEIVGVVFLKARCNGSEVFELVEEALDQVAEAVEEGLNAGMLVRRANGLMLAQAPRPAN